MDYFVASHENRLIVRRQWFACLLNCVKSFAFKLREKVQPILHHSLLISLLRFEIAFNAGVFFFFLLAGHANNSLSLSQTNVCAADCWYGWLNYNMFFLSYLQGLINMKLYDKQLYANLEDLTVYNKCIHSRECRRHHFLIILYFFL